nr:hypothetical protein [Rhodocyclus tenuis]
MLADIGRTAENLLHLLDAPRRAAHRVAALRQVLDDFLDAEGPAGVAVQVEVVDVAHDQRFGRIDVEALLLAPAAARNVGLDGAIAERRFRAVVEALPRVLAHRARGVLRVLLALVLVKEAEQAPRHFPGAVLARLLRDRNDLHAVALQPLLVNAELDQVEEEARQTVHDDRLEGGRLVHRIADHLLEHRPLVVGGRSTGFDIFADGGMAVGGAPLAQLAELIGNRQIVIGLAGGRDAGIECDVHVFLRGDGFPSPAWLDAGYERQAIKAKRVRFAQP